MATGVVFSGWFAILVSAMGLLSAAEIVRGMFHGLVMDSQQERAAGHLGAQQAMSGVMAGFAGLALLGAETMGRGGQGYVPAGKSGGGQGQGQGKDGGDGPPSGLPPGGAGGLLDSQKTGQVAGIWAAKGGRLAGGMVAAVAGPAAGVIGPVAEKIGGTVAGAAGRGIGSLAGSGAQIGAKMWEGQGQGFSSAVRAVTGAGDPLSGMGRIFTHAGAQTVHPGLGRAAARNWRPEQSRQPAVADTEREQAHHHQADAPPGGQTDPGAGPGPFSEQEQPAGGRAAWWSEAQGFGYRPGAGRKTKTMTDADGNEFVKAADYYGAGATSDA